MWSRLAQACFQMHRYLSELTRTCQGINSCLLLSMRWWGPADHEAVGDEWTLFCFLPVPGGNVSNLASDNIQNTSVTISWTSVPCAQRGGVLVRYDVMVKLYNDSGLEQMLTTNTTSVVIEHLTPFTSYVVAVRYVNTVGAGPYGEELHITTAQGGIVTLPAWSTSNLSLSLCLILMG